jgi:universal stress protein A
MARRGNGVPPVRTLPTSAEPRNESSCGVNRRMPTFGKGKAITGKHECVSKSKLSKNRDPFASFRATSNSKTMNILTETSRPSIAGKGDPVELVPAILKLKSILVPIDFSKISQKALEYAVPLAKQFEAKITLLYAIEPLPYPVDLTYVSMGEGFPIKPLEKELNALAKNTIEPQLLKEVLVRVGTAFEVITNVARDCKADLIVITTHGHTGLKHVFMGSTAERVVRHAPCPAFVVRKCEDEFI